MNENALQLSDYRGANSGVLASAYDSSAITKQIQMIQKVMEESMKENVHYGVIPGTGKKPTLLKAGSEKLSMMFRLCPEFDIIKIDLPNGHREYQVICSLTHILTGAKIGQGVGCCSTMESKYRYRNVSDYELTGEPIPKDSKEKKAEYRKQGFGMKNIDGQWHWVKYKSGEKQENPDIADTYNTVLKMAKKRAQIDATLTATAASDIFAQDLEDLPPDQLRQEPSMQQQPRNASQQQKNQGSSPQRENQPDDIRQMAKDFKTANQLVCPEHAEKIKICFDQRKWDYIRQWHKYYAGAFK